MGEWVGASPFAPLERIKVIPCGTKIADLLPINHGRPTPAQNATGLQHAAFAALGEVHFKGIIGFMTTAYRYKMAAGKFGSVLFPCKE